MVLTNDRYKVSIHVQWRPPLDSCEVVYNPEKININDVCSAWLIEIEKQAGEVRRVALVDLVTSGYEPCAVLEEDLLTVILFDAIVRLDLDTGMIVQRVECDNMGGLFEIHPITDGYIIWGEGEVFRYDLDLNRIWWRSGRDILVSQTGEKSFWIENGQIHYRDWEGWHYVLDLDGNVIGDYQETTPDG